MDTYSCEAATTYRGGLLPVSQNIAYKVGLRSPQVVKDPL